MFFWIIYEFSFVFDWNSRKMDQKRKIQAIVGGLRSGEETPRSGEGPHSGEGPPRRSEALKEGWPGLRFFAEKSLFTAWKCCFFVSFCFFRCSETCLLD